MNYINASVVDKDRRIRKLQEEVSVLRRQLEGMKTEYNNRFVAALNELGFEAEEITESGEIKFAVGSPMDPRLLFDASNMIRYTGWPCPEVCIFG